MHFLSFRSRMRRAFTLIELIVVVAIILIMAAILMPVFHRPSHNAPRSSCQSHLKQIALGIKQYVQDYDKRYPIWQHGSNRSSGWAATIQPYVKSTQLFQCPSETTDPNPDPASSGYSDYFYNSNLGPQKGGRAEEKLEAPALTIMNGDAAPFSASNSSNGGTITAVGPPAVDGTQAGLAIAQGQWDPAVSGMRHLDGANYSFADGHVKWVKPSKITRDPTHSGSLTFRWSAKKSPDSGS